jgi:glycosyltransferase involved in cell wall biosynthesis
MCELICRIDPARFDLHVACLGREGSLYDRVAAAAPVTEFPIRGLITAGAARQAARFAAWCRTRNIAVMHACDFYANVFALAPAAVAGIAVRIGSRRDVSIPERTAAQARVQRLAYRCAHRVVTNSGAAAARLVEEGVASERITLIANGIDMSQYAGAPDVSARTITTVAHLRPGKGIDVLLDAAALLCREVPDVLFRIAGDGGLRASLEARRARLGLEARVQFLGHVADVPTLLGRGGIFAFPSLMEASPNAVIEAMSAGLPVVATNVGGIPEVVEHDRNGLLVPAGDPAALASALRNLLGDAPRCRRLGAAARATIGERFSHERMVDAFHTLYLSELGRRRPEAVTGGAAVGKTSPPAAHGDRVPVRVEPFESKMLQ